jgi:hypothetical protein
MTTNRGVQVRRSARIVIAALLAALATAVGAPAAARAGAGCEVSVSDEAVIEGDVGSTRLRFLVTARGCGAGSVQVRTGGPYGLPPASPSSDFTAVTARTVSLSAAGPPLAVVVAVVVEVIGDTVYEGDELVWLEVYNPVGVTVVDPIGQGVVYNDDVPPADDDKGDDEILMTEPRGLRVTEALLVVLGERALVDVTVHYATVDGTAVAGQDYVGVPHGTAVLRVGEPHVALPVRIRADRPAGGPEHFYVRIFEPSAGRIVVSQAKVTIPPA